MNFSFCKRQRSLSENTLVHRLNIDSININNYGFFAYILSPDSEHVLSLNITYFPHNSYHVLIDEISENYNRFRVSKGDVILDKIEPESVITTVENDRLILIGSNDKVIVNFSPFWIEFYKENELVMSLNKRSLLQFEHERIKIVENTVDMVNEQNLNNENEKEAGMIQEKTTDDSSTNMDGKIEEENDVVNQSDDIKKNDLDVNLPWSEKFKDHLDSRPYGLNSISLDVDFININHVYGIPEHADNLRLKSTNDGDPYRLYNLDVFEYEIENPMALYGSVPVMWGHNVNHTVGIFWFNPSETWIDIEHTSNNNKGLFSRIPQLFTPSLNSDTVKTRWISESGLLDTYIFLGSSPHDVSKAYMYFTGTTKLPPLFGLAYHQSRWNYNNEADVLSVDKHFDEYQIPVDVIWLDIEHTNGKRYFTWDHDKFPNPGDMILQLNHKGRKIVTTVDPHIKRDESWKLYTDAQNTGVFVKSRDGQEYDGWCWPGSSSWPDFTDSMVRRWWSKLFLGYQPFTKDSLFTWNDMGEPSIFNGPEVTMHKDALHVNGWEHRDVHNIYGLYVHQASWVGQLLRSEGMERPFVLTRAFFAGSQRTAAVWTGDNTASWKHLQYSLPMVLSLSITGITFSGADIGGFFGNPDPELLTRWYQAAAYQPFFRAHAHMDTKRREPWLVPEVNMKIIRSAIQSRYNLLPYWYTMFARFEEDGQPAMAPMWYHFPKDLNTFSMDNQHMVGESILVHPVVEPGVTAVEVYFPKGIWYHIQTFKYFVGDKFVKVPVTLSTVPAFYRGGFIIPRKERIRRSSWLMRYDPYTLLVFADLQQSSAVGYVYYDDFHSTSLHTARLYQIQFMYSSNYMGGLLKLIRLPLPGHTSFSNETVSNAEFVPKIERIVFVGFYNNLDRVTVLDNRTNKRRNVQFMINPSVKLDTSTNIASTIIVPKPDLYLNDQWELHLVIGHELKDDL